MEVGLLDEETEERLNALTLCGVDLYNSVVKLDLEVSLKLTEELEVRELSMVEVWILDEKTEGK